MAAAAGAPALLSMHQPSACCLLQRQQQQAVQRRRSAAAARTGSSSSCSNVQRVPRRAIAHLHQLHAVAAHHQQQHYHHHHQQQRCLSPASVRAAAAAPAAASAAFAAAHESTPSSSSISSSSGQHAHSAGEAAHNRARLYSLYDFISTQGRLPGLQDTHRGVPIGQWAERCRQQHQPGGGGLDPQLAAALASIPGWTWEPQLGQLTDTFNDSVAWLRSYTQQCGSLPPLRLRRASPQADAGGESTAVAGIRKQLMEQRKRGVLTQQQIDYVVDQVPGWRWDPRVRAPPLDELVTILTTFQQQHGHLPRGEDRLPCGFQIGEWCMARRGEFSRGQLERDVAALLERNVPGWCWNAQDDAFEASLALLLRFAAQHGRMPTQRESMDGARIGAWCNKRRLQYKAGTMPADRVAALEAVPGWWWSADQLPNGGPELEAAQLQQQQQQQGG